MSGECKRCGDSYTVRPDCEPGDWCDRCAQETAAEMFAVVSKLVEWDKANPKGRCYPIGPNDVEKHLDAICTEARRVLGEAVGMPETKAIVDRDKEICSTCGVSPAEPPHTCPKAVEIYNDTKTLCNCCSYCTDGCALDI